MPPITQTTYRCNLCKFTSSQKSHNDIHINSEPHKDKVRIAKGHLRCKTIEQLKEKYPKFKESEVSKNKLIRDIIKDESSIKIVKYKETTFEATGLEKKTISNEIIWNDSSNILSKSETSIKFMNIIKSTHQLFYDDNVNGEKSIRDLMKVFSLIILRPLFNDENSIIWKKCLDMRGSFNQEDFVKYISYCKNPLNITNDESPIYEWEDLVSEFLIKIIPDYFNETDKKLNCKKNCFINVIKSLLRVYELFEWDMTKPHMENYKHSLQLYNGDMMGDINEYFKNKYGGTGKELGQFFTPSQLINSITVGLGVNDLIKDSGNLNLGDPCMGSAGLLVNCYHYNNDLHIYGGEVDADTIKWSFQSILLKTGRISTNLSNSDSLINDDMKKGNRITNPPFKIRMKYEQERKAYESKYGDTQGHAKFEDIYPLKMNDPEALFIQNCVYYLDDNCVCAIILPYGKIFESREERFVKLREWLFKKVDVIKLMLMPRGVFDYADPLTCTLVFVKRPSTNNLQISKVSKDCSQITNLFTLTDEDINTSVGWCPFSLAYSDYIHHELRSKLSGQRVKCRDVFKIIRSSLNSGSADVNPDGEYTLVTGAKYSNWYKINSYDEDGEYVFIGVGGNGDAVPIKYFKGKFKYTNLMGKMKINPEFVDKINVEYLYILFLNNQSYIEEYMQKGSSNRTLHDNRLYDMIITIPPLDEQTKYIELLEKNKQEIKKTELMIQQLQTQQALLKDEYFPKN